jgi:hypothetical protein
VVGAGPAIQRWSVIRRQQLVAGYIPWFGKKLERLAESERELAALLAASAGEAGLAEVAQAVRSAQIRALRAKRSQLPPSEKNAVAVSNLGHEIDFWQALSVADVIEGYRSGRLRGHRATAVRAAR